MELKLLVSSKIALHITHMIPAATKFSMMNLQIYAMILLYIVILLVQHCFYTSTNYSLLELDVCCVFFFCVGVV